MLGRGSSGRAVAGRPGSRALRSVFPHRGMPLRRRVSLAAAAAVAVAIALAVVVCYVAVSYRLHSQLDNQLKAEGASDRVAALGSGNYNRLPMAPAYRGGPSPYRSIVLSSGVVGTLQDSAVLPAYAVARAVARGTEPSGFHDVTYSGTEILVYTIRLGETDYGEGVALELGRPLTQSTSLLHELRLILLVVFLLAVPLAALFGRFAARRVLRPLAEVTATAEAIAETDDLSRRIDVHEDDEVGQLASGFNAMLERLTASREELDSSVRSQRQLVADASHELRTPLTSLRTNVEVLLASPDLDDSDRQLLEDVLEQSEELSTVVADLIEVARGDLSAASLEDVRLDTLVEEALVRAHRNNPDNVYHETLAPVVVQGSPDRLARAINNLLDNAAKHAGEGSVDVVVNASGVSVRDHGMGIDPADLPHVFERFYRGINSRSTQGSGLGLAIVRQTAELHGGSVRAANAPGGGAIFTLELPTSPLEEPRPSLFDDPVTDGADAGDSTYGTGGFATRA